MKKYIWLLCKVAFIALTLLVFSPLVLSVGETAPSFLGMPRTLWSGLLVSLGFIIITIIGSSVINSKK